MSILSLSMIVFVCGFGEATKIIKNGVLTPCSINSFDYNVNLDGSAFTFNSDRVDKILIVDIKQKLKEY